MPSSSALVILAEFDKAGLLLPGLAGEVVRPSDARRLGLATLRDCVDKGRRCAGFDTFVAYYPSERRGEVEEAVGARDVWAEPLAGRSRGLRAETFLRHLLEERTYRRAVALYPGHAAVPRQRIFDVAHALRVPAGLAIAVAPSGQVGLLGVREAVPLGLGNALDARAPSSAIAAASLQAGRSPETFSLAPPVESEEELARAVFDLRAEIATGKVAGDDLPLHTLEQFAALGLEVALRGDGGVVVRRAGPPRAPRA